MQDKTDLTTNNEERRIVEQLWQELKPLHRLLHAYIRKKMVRRRIRLFKIEKS